MRLPVLAEPLEEKESAYLPSAWVGGVQVPRASMRKHTRGMLPDMAGSRGAASLTAMLWPGVRL